jgi:hypothetical protein
MRKKGSARLLAVVKRLERDIEVTSADGLPAAAQLLRMARLDLLCQIYGISDDELTAFFDELAASQRRRGATVIHLAERRRQKTSPG